jgi:hypothetical protein
MVFLWILNLPLKLNKMDADLFTKAHVIIVSILQPLSKIRDDSCATINQAILFLMDS